DYCIEAVISSWCDLSELHKMVCVSRLDTTWPGVEQFRTDAITFRYGKYTRTALLRHAPIFCVGCATGQRCVRGRHEGTVDVIDFREAVAVGGSSPSWLGPRFFLTV